MENAQVIFKGEDSKEITLDLHYDKENSSLDYDVKFSENYDPKSQMDFIGFLAKMFLNSLQ